MKLKHFKRLLDNHFKEDDDIYFTSSCGCVRIGQINHGTYFLTFEPLEGLFMNDSLMKEVKEMEESDLEQSERVRYTIKYWNFNDDECGQETYDSSEECLKGMDIDDVVVSNVNDLINYGFDRVDVYRDDELVNSYSVLDDIEQMELEQ
jgi:hypothetical protein